MIPSFQLFGNFRTGWSPAPTDYWMCYSSMHHDDFTENDPQNSEIIAKKYLKLTVLR